MEGKHLGGSAMLTGTPSQHVAARKQKGMREGGAPGQWDVPTCHSCYGQALEQKDPASSTLLCPVSFATRNKKDFGIALFLPHDLGPSLQCQSGEAHSCPSHRRLRGEVTCTGSHSFHTAP